MATTSEIAHKLLRYYRGAQRIFNYGRFRAMRWAVSEVLKELVEQRK